MTNTDYCLLIYAFLVICLLAVEHELRKQVTSQQFTIDALIRHIFEREAPNDDNRESDNDGKITNETKE